VFTGKGKVFPVHAIKVYRGSRRIYPFILYIVTGRKWIVTFAPGKTYDARWVRIWLGARAGLDIFGKSLFPLLGF